MVSREGTATSSSSPVNLWRRKARDWRTSPRATSTQAWKISNAPALGLTYEIVETEGFS